MPGAAVVDTALLFPFDLVTTVDFLAAESEAGRLRVGAQAYRTLVIPPLRYRASGWEQAVRRSVGAGVRVFALDDDGQSFDETAGCRSRWSPEAPGVEILGLEGSAREGFRARGWEALAAACADPLGLEGEGNDDVFLRHARLAEGDTWLLCNTVSKPRQLVLHPPCSDRTPALWDARRTRPRALQPGPDGGWLLRLVGHEVALVVIEEESAAAGPAGQAPAGLRREPRTIPLSPTWRFSTDRRNALILDRWVVDDRPGADLADIDFRIGLPVVAPGEAGAVSAGEGRRTMTLKTVVTLDGIPRDTGIVVEPSGIGGEYEMYCNGVRCARRIPARQYDNVQFEHPIDGQALDAAPSRFYGPGEAVIAVRITVDGPGQGLREPLRLFGWFTVELNSGESIGARLSALPDDLYIGVGSWADQGFPHFAGEGIYEQELVVEEDLGAALCRIRLETGGDAAEVLINSVSAGVAAWEPFVVESTGLLKAGVNTLTVKVANTLESLLYGTRKASGLRGQVGVELVDQ
jgi:hypothetical protein